MVERLARAVVVVVLALVVALVGGSPVYAGDSVTVPYAGGSAAVWVTGSSVTITENGTSACGFWVFGWTDTENGNRVLIDNTSTCTYTWSLSASPELVEIRSASAESVTFTSDGTIGPFPSGGPGETASPTPLASASSSASASAEASATPAVTPGSFEGTVVVAQLTGQALEAYELIEWTLVLVGGVLVALVTALLLVSIRR